MTEQLLAISGLGSIGLQHLRAASGLGGVRTAVFDPDPLRRTQALQEGGAHTAAGSFEELLDRDPTAVVVAGPDHTHLSQLLAATERGIPTLVEKPLAPTASQAAEAQQAVTATATSVLVGYVLRYRTALRMLRSLLHEGVIGRPVGAQVMLGAYRTLEVASSRFDGEVVGHLYRDYSHEWDYLAWLFGPVTRVTATARTAWVVERVQSPNCVDGVLAFGDSDVAATFHLDYVEPVGARFVQVMGSGGWARLDLVAGLLEIERPGVPRWRLELHQTTGEGLALQMAHLMQVAEGEATPVVTFADGVRALAVADAVRRSVEDAGWVDVEDHR